MAKNPLEEMYLPCPEDICDGSGMVWNPDLGVEEACLCMKGDPFDVEPNEREI